MADSLQLDRCLPSPEDPLRRSDPRVSTTITSQTGSPTSHTFCGQSHSRLPDSLTLNRPARLRRLASSSRPRPLPRRCPDPALDRPLSGSATRLEPLQRRPPASPFPTAAAYPAQTPPPPYFPLFILHPVPIRSDFTTLPQSNPPTATLPLSQPLPDAPLTTDTYIVSVCGQRCGGGSIPSLGRGGCGRPFRGFDHSLRWP
jgi:hypothetical protein